jgi:hypothetical protein
MTPENLKKANDLACSITEISEKINWIQQGINDEAERAGSIRIVFHKIMGGGIDIQKAVSKDTLDAILQIILTNLQKQLSEAEKEFEAL